jgi:hypothetical protein
MDSSVYFTLYGLGKIAESLKKFGPYRQLSRYDRTKIAGRVYTLLSDKDLAIIKKNRSRYLHNNNTKRRGALKTIP